MPTRKMLSVQAIPDRSGMRTSELFGEEHTIIPCIALVEGVLWPANAPSPELALAEEFGRFPDGWNGRPVVYNHPQINGMAVSASSPDVLEDNAFGSLFNTELKGNKLKTEIWINNVRVETMSEDIQDTVRRLKDGDETIEVSTGLFTMSEVVKGEFEGEEFEAVWRNIVPDHLAVLPEGVIGACSVADGCGAPRSNQMKPVMRAAQMNTNACKCQDKNDCQCTTPKAGQKGVFQKLMEYTANIGANILQIRGNSENLSDMDTRTAIQSALSDQESYFWIMAVFDGGDGTGIVVYEAFDTGKLYERTFGINTDGAVTIGAEKTEVRPVTQFVAVPQADDVTDNSAGDIDADTQDGSIQENQMKTKDQLVNDLVALATNEFTEDDRAWLSTLEESQLAKFHVVGDPIDDVTPTPTEVIVDDPATIVADVVVDNASAPISTEDYIKAAPVEVQEVLNDSLRLHSSRKATLVKSLLANTRCPYTEPQLTVKPLTELEQLATLAGSDVSFEGAAPLRANATDDADAPPAPVQLFDLSSKVSA